MNTKYQSLTKITPTAKTKTYQLIKAALTVHGPLSRSQLADVTSLRLSSVCGRVSELISMGELVEVGTIFDATTKRNVKTVELVTHSLTPRETIVTSLRQSVGV
jgi:hypothetical protein